MTVKTLPLISFIVIACTCHGSAYFPDVESLEWGVNSRIVGIIKDQQQLRPVIYRYAEAGVLPKVVIHVSCELPSILLGNETKEFGQENYVLNLGGEDIRKYDYSSDGGWIYSRWLGWVYVANFPSVYSPQSGWLYFIEVSNTSYWEFNYSTEEWNFRDLLKEWISKYFAKLYE